MGKYSDLLKRLEKGENISDGQLLNAKREDEADAVALEAAAVREQAHAAGVAATQKLESDTRATINKHLERMAELKEQEKGPRAAAIEAVNEHRRAVAAYNREFYAVRDAIHSAYPDAYGDAPLRVISGGCVSIDGTLCCDIRNLY